MLVMLDKIDVAISNVFQTAETSFALNLKHLGEMGAKQHMSVSELQ